MPAPNADPHGGIEDFKEVDKLDHCIPIHKKKRGISKSKNEVQIFIFSEQVLT